MSTLQREKVLDVPNTGPGRTGLKLNNVSITVTSTYQREILLNPDTEYEERLVSDAQSVQKTLYFDATSDERFAALQNLQTTVLDLALENEAEALAKMTLKGAPADPVEVAARTVSTSGKTSLKA